MTTLTNVKHRNWIEETGNRLREKQNQRLDVMDEHALGNRNGARRDYERTKRWALMQKLGDVLHCNCIDPNLFSMFSDWYKEEHGFRPRGAEWTYTRCRKHWELRTQQTVQQAPASAPRR